MKYKIIKFQEHIDSRGMLIAIEERKEIPFSVKRIYYLYNTPCNARRGYHAHKNLQQILISVHGSCKIHLDDGEKTDEVFLNNPGEGLFISHSIWREMYDFSDDCVLLVLASDIYDEKDYIRDYQEFLNSVGKKGN